MLLKGCLKLFRISCSCTLSCVIFQKHAARLAAHLRIIIAVVWAFLQGLRYIILEGGGLKFPYTLNPKP